MNYTHNNKTVKYQEIIGKSFLDILSEHGILPTELPDPDFRYRVFSYNSSNEKHCYAAVIVANAPDEYIEKVFITESIPEDGFWNMMLDVSGQKSGEDPRKIESRLHLVEREAQKRADELVQKKYPSQAATWMLCGYPKEVENEIQEIKKIVYIECGYNKSILDSITADDLDLEYVKNILND